MTRMAQNIRELLDVQKETLIQMKILNLHQDNADDEEFNETDIGE